MNYTILGKSGLNLSRLGFGGMRFPMKNDKVDRDKAIPLLHRAFELGINFVDTAVFYCNDSETAVGEALASWKKNRIYVSTKNPHYDINNEKQWWTHLETSLKRLQIDSIDIYNQHGISNGSFENFRKMFHSCMIKAKEQGMIKNIAFSFHDNAEILKKIVDEIPEFVSVILQYNLLDRNLEPAFPYLKKKNIGIIAMGPVAGGKLALPGNKFVEKLKIPAVETALRFVLSNPDVNVAISGMSDIQQLEENIKIASKTEELSELEHNKIRLLTDELAELKKIYCTGCSYCMPCESGVNIPEIFRYYILYKVYGIIDEPVNFYNLLGKEKHWVPGKNAESCTECGACMKKCPQKIDIIKQLKEADKLLRKTG